MKNTSRARFSKKNLILAKKFFLGSKRPKIKVFATLRENGSNDFAHIAYLDRSHQYLQLFYWHQVLEKSSRAFRGHFRSKFWVFQKNFFSKIEIFQKKIFFSIFRFFSFWVEKCKKSFFSIVRSGHLRLRIFHKKVENRNFSNSTPLFSSLSHRIGPIPHIMQV